MNVNELFNIIKSIAKKQHTVHSIYDGDVYKNWNSSEVKYGSVNMALETVRYSQNMNYYSVVLYYADRLLQDSTNVNSVVTDGLNTLQSIINEIENTYEEIVVEDDIIFTPFEQQFADVLGGVYCTVIITSSTDIGICTYEDFDTDFDNINFSTAPFAGARARRTSDDDTEPTASIRLVELSSNQTIEYSYNTETWTPMTEGVTVKLSGDTAIYLRGMLTGDNTSGDRTRFMITGDLQLKGNMNAIWNYEDLNAPLKPYCGYRMFYGCSDVTDFSDLILPSTELAAHCYDGMFTRCTNLTKTPTLPATTLADYCYYCMFEKCSSLVTAPELPATTLSDNCYNSMFYACSSLTTAPELPATTLASGCYYSTFNGCTNLTTVSELPATTLASNCYQNMFYDCTSLTTAPELPATTLANACYDSMFASCSSLIAAPELPATTLAERCYSSMFLGCTNLTTASELPATELSKWCYQSMFYGCTNLTTAPELPATTLVEGCYETMFYDCTKLNYIKCLATSGTDSNLGTHVWVYGVASTGTFVKHPDATWTTGNSGIPSGWEVIDNV